MPIYEYLCQMCGARFTKLEPMSAARDGKVCPECGAPRGRRLISSFATSSNGDSQFAGCYPDCGPTG